MSQSQVPSIPITSSQLGGAIVVNIFALLSALALTSVIVRVGWLAIRRTWFKSSLVEAQETVFFQTQLGNYASCLIIGMMFNTIAGVVGIKWLVQHAIAEGFACKFSALMMQIGNFSTGYFTIAIAVHTFNSLVMKMRQSAIICRTTITTGWVLAGLIGVAPFWIHLPQGPIYGPDALGCGVRPIYPKLQFFFHILPILLASTFGAVLYSLIFLILRGTLKLRSGFKLTLDPEVRWKDSDGLGENYHRFIARVARSMLWYPVAYITFLIPYAITRLFLISGFAMPFQWIVFASVCWYSLSFADVLLLYNTFRVLGPAFDARSSVATRKLESFGAASNLDKNGPSPDPDQQGDMEKRIHQYRSQNFGSPSDERTTMSHNANSSQDPLIPLHFAADGLSDRNSGYSNATLIGRLITVGSDYRLEDVPPPTPPKDESLTYQMARSSTHIRNNSSLSGGLPAPPRRIRSPALSLSVTDPSQSTREEIDERLHSDQWLMHQRSTNTFGHQESLSPRSPPIRSPSLYSDEGEGESTSEWSSRNLSLAVRRQPSEQSMLSAFSPAFPAQRYPRSLPQSAVVDDVSGFSTKRHKSSASSPPKGHRPLVSYVSRNNSVDRASMNFGPGTQPRRI